MKFIRGSKVSIENIADDFYEAYHRCLISDQQNHIVAIPAFVNGLFACELYFKSLLKTENNCHEHNLKKLFDLLDEEYKKEIQSVKSNDKNTLDDLLSKIGDGFKIWRYLYEDNNENFGEGYPFDYTESFLKSYLPVIKKTVDREKQI